jgi:hypothetical protein
VNNFQVQTSMKGDGHFAPFETLEIGHTLYPVVQRVQSWPIPEMQYYGLNKDDFVFVRLPGVKHFVLAPDTVWYGRLNAAVHNFNPV